MPKFLTIGYGDQAGYDRTGEEVKNAAHAHDAELLASGALMARAGAPVQVRNHENAGVQTQLVAFMQSELPIAGFMVIEATNADEAIQLVAKTPCAVAYGVVEVWPLVMS
ncbi:MAG: hypothetical protein WCF24_06055 [Acidimicrobiales bacterium]